MFPPIPTPPLLIISAPVDVDVAAVLLLIVRALVTVEFNEYVTSYLLVPLFHANNDVNPLVAVKLTLRARSPNVGSITILGLGVDCLTPPIVAVVPIVVIYDAYVADVA